MANPIQYVSRTFNTILNDINSDPELVDKPNWWKRLWAGIGDVLSMWLNAVANNSFLRTAFTRQAVKDLLQLIDYELSPQTTSSGTLIFYIKNSATFPFTVEKTDLIGLTQGSVAVSSKRFEARSSQSVSAVSEAILDSDVDTGTDQLTVSREYYTGEKVVITGADLPVPLSSGTGYYIIKIDATHIKLATTIANAYAGNAIDITALGTGNITIELYSFKVTAYQQELKSDVEIGSSDGSTAFQEISLPDINILEDTITLLINSATWTRVDTFINSGPTDRHFILIYNTDNSSYVRFGDGTFGAIPPAFDITATYAVGGGANSNISSFNKINTYAGNNENVEGVSNRTEFTGGGDPEAIATAKILGPLLLKSRDRFVTLEDGEALALGYGGLTQAKLFANAFGVLSVRLIGIAVGGGNPSSSLKSELENYLLERSLLESVDIRAQDTTITATNITSAAKVLTGYSYSNIEKYFRLAWKLLLTETGFEIQDIYDSEGISATVELINSLFSESFDVADHDQIEILVQNFEPLSIGDDINESSVYGFIDSYVIGIDYITISSPSFPISFAEDEISTVGTLTLSEIT